MPGRRNVQRFNLSFLLCTLLIIGMVKMSSSGNMSILAVSGLINIEPSLSSQLIGRSRVTFDPPTRSGEPPTNLRVEVSGVQCGRPDDPSENVPVIPDSISEPEGLLGYNVYRVRVNPDGSIPPVEEIAREENLVGAVQADNNNFTENLFSEGPSNFCYTISSFYAGFGPSQPSNSATTQFPILGNPIIRKGVLFFDVSGSNIRLPAQLIFNDKEAFDLQLDSTRAFFTIPPNARSVPGGIKFKKFLKKKGITQIKLRLSDGTCYPV